MYASTFFLLLAVSPITIYAQNSSTPTVLCVPGQCLQGYSNTTIGAKLSSPGAATSVHLLPGQYTSTTNPQLLHDILTSSSASISSSPGFSNSTSLSLPLNLALQPGLSIFSNPLYAGQSAFSAVPSNPISNSSTPLSAQSIALSSSVWATVTTTSNHRVVLWNSIPDVSQLGQASGPFSLVDLQSSACSPTCAGSGICTTSGTCKCAAGFTGSSCEVCASGFFGPTCQACPAGCDKCDDGINGSGRCIKLTVANDPSTCNCLNGVCGSNGQCTCNPGFTTAANGTACAKCSQGFFLTSTGDCKACNLGCNSCTDGTGVCTACKSGFSQNPSDQTKCNPPTSATTSGAICPDGSFSTGAACTKCASACQTCTGGTSNDCILCASGTYTLNGTCVSASSTGVCSGTSLIADNNKHVCDTCGAKCTACQIPNFNGASIVSQLQCTGCLPGSVLSNGACVDSCPSGTFLSPKDNLTCQACDSSCATCSGSSTFCLTCNSNQLASSGKCVASCPSGTFTSSGSCLPCHPDCASCSGGSFNQCSACSANRPVLNNGRCLPTCSPTQFFDSGSGSCQTCDSSCSSCSGAGPNNCLACSNSNSILRGGTCVAADCQDSTSVVPGLGVCLSELINVPKPSGTSSAAPLPSITGLTTPTVVSTRRPLAWWEILLMALGCAFIFLMFIWLWRRRAQKKREKQTALFAQGAVVNRGKSSWRWRLVRLGEKLFGHKKSTARKIVVIRNPEESESMKLTRLRAAEEARIEEGEVDMVRLIGSYQDRAPSPPASRYYPGPNHTYLTPERPISEASRISAPSLYSQMTGMPRRTPEPRQPVRKNITSRFSTSTASSDNPPPKQPGKNPFWK